MTYSRIAMVLFFLAGLLFLIVALMPLLRGDELDSTFLVLAIVFVILGLANLRRGPGRDGSPPA